MKVCFCTALQINSKSLLRFHMWTEPFIIIWYLKLPEI